MYFWVVKPLDIEQISKHTQAQVHVKKMPGGRAYETPFFQEDRAENSVPYHATMR